MTKENFGRTEADVALIWKHTHKDFRGRIDGVRTVMFNLNGQTTLSAIIDLPSDVYEDKFKSAQRSELCLQRDLKLNPVLKQYGLQPEVGRQFRNSLDDIKIVLRGALSPAEYENAVADIVAAQIVFPD
jgi:hypothetical protein